MVGKSHISYFELSLKLLRRENVGKERSYPQTSSSLRQAMLRCGGGGGGVLESVRSSGWWKESAEKLQSRRTLFVAKGATIGGRRAQAAFSL